jgi:hypothetical protein
MLTLRRVVVGFTLLAIVASLALSGCAWAVDVRNGHWEKHPDGSRTCEPGGTECFNGSAHVGSKS